MFETRDAAPAVSSLPFLPSSELLLSLIFRKAVLPSPLSLDCADVTGYKDFL